MCVLQYTRRGWLKISPVLTALLEIVLDQGAERAVLEEPGSPRHGRLDYFVTDLKNHGEPVLYRSRDGVGRGGEGISNIL